MTEPDLRSVRRWFAEELQYVGDVRSKAVVQAFASVQRERFAGPGPWRILSPNRSEDYWTTEDADPRRLCHDVLVAIDETRRLNNGQPSLWAQLLDVLDLAAGDHVIHVGAGQGYYTAIIAEIVGPTGRVTAIEIDPDLATKARGNLAGDWPQATVIAADGFAHRADAPADAVVVNAGVTHLSRAWLDALAPENGRLLVPLTGANWTGGFLLITRNAGDAPISRALRDADGHYSLRRRPRPHGGSATERSAGAIGIQRHPLLATRARGARRDLLARGRGMVAIDSGGGRETARSPAIPCMTLDTPPGCGFRYGVFPQGAKVWFGESELELGENLRSSITAAIESSNSVVAVLSSKVGSAELRAALDRHVLFTP